MTKTKRIWRIIVSLAAVLVLAAALLSVGSPTTIGNAASLKHIDEIVAESGTFNILEIVPDTSAASFGYYIDGQEPISSAYFDTYTDGAAQINGWKAALAQKTSPADRTTFVNGLFTRLESKGVLGNGTTTPLKYTYKNGTDYYAESYLVADPQNWSKLHLKSAESVTMTGSFSALENGDFRAEYTYSPAANGGYIQNIAYFSYAAGSTSGTYYYNPTFTPITAGTNLTGWDNVAVYIKNETTGVYAFEKDSEGKDIITVKDYLNPKNGGFDSDKIYYYVDPLQTGAPTSYSSTNCYAAIVGMNDNDDAPRDGYTAPPMTGDPLVAGPSYFSRSISSYTYVGTNGNSTYSSTGSTQYTVNFTDIFYKGGFINNNLFKKYVLGLVDPLNNPNNEPDYNALNVTVTVKKASEVSPADISAAGMIYLSSGTDIYKSGTVPLYTAANDIPDAQAVQIYNYAANLNPVIIDYAIIQNITQLNNIQKLCQLSLQSAIAPTTQTSLSGLTVDSAKLAYITSDADKAVVNNNVFCFDAFNTASTATIPNIDSPGPKDVFTVVSALYNESFTSNVYSSGFTAVLEEIQNENFLKQIAGETNLLPENVTVSASIRHIINFKGLRKMEPKESIKVLDLEPAKVSSSTWLTKDTVRRWINKTAAAFPDNNIEIVHMTTGEFIGKIEDINETYDMIYIGMNTESMNTSGGNTDYNDPNMDGLIYSNIGDLYRASLELSGIRAQDYVYVGSTKAINGGNNTTANQFRFSGNDITNAKVTELRKFAQAGYPIILGHGFVSDSGTINTDKVDNSSYMYTAVSSIYGTYDNVIKQLSTGTVTNPDTVIKYLNVSKPTVTMTVKPVDYADDNNAAIAVDPNDGYYYLKYVFSIGNLTDPTPVTTTYDCKVFIDLNADGRYSDNEGLNDIEVHRVSDGALVLPLKDSNDKEYYTLSADIAYQVTRQMPSDYAGIIPWKLEVIKNDADHIHASAQGYSRMASVDPKKINVLQIMQPGTLDTKLNLAKQTTEKNADGTFKGIYGRLINGLDDFDVTINVITTDVLDTKGTTSEDILTWINEKSFINAAGAYEGADMLIIGFNDCYDGIKAKSADAIVKYISSGKSVLFTHDTTSLSQVPESNFPMAINGTSQTKNLTNSDILYNTSDSTFRNVKNSDPEVQWYESTNGERPPNITSAGYRCVVFIKGTPTESTEADYFGMKADISGSYQIYKITNDAYIKVPGVTDLQSLNTYKTNNGITSPTLYIYCTAASGNYTDPAGDLAKNRQNIVATYNITKFVGGIKYNLNSYSYHYDVGNNGNTSMAKTSYTAHLMCLFKGSVNNYTYIGTYDSVSNTYSIGGATWYPATGAAYPQSTLYSIDPADPNQYIQSTIPSSISDWGYFFNTRIRDAVGLDRYGVTSLEPISDTNQEPLGSIVNVNAPLSNETVQTILGNSRSVAFTPDDGKGSTVNEYQGYTNYALIRFAASGNTYKYTNNTYTNRETTNVSQVNKGQITTYPYNVNSASFGGNDSTIIGYGNSYMKIGLTHEQYFQINMNTDDIVVWYCMSNGGTDGNSYYDDVPNDCVNAYYIYNKGNVTYSGVGHSSNASLYTGSTIGQEYINEAKLFVNTMIAAYQSAAQAPNIAIKKDARGTSDSNDMYMLTDNASVLSVDMSPTDESRAVYYRISDPNVGVSKTITVQYYVASSGGSMVAGINEPVLPLAPDNVAGMPLTTYNSNGIAVPMTDNAGTMETRLKGGYVYKLYLPYTNCLEKLMNDSVYSVRIYVKVTTMIGLTPMTPAVDSIEIKKQQLFELS